MPEETGFAIYWAKTLDGAQMRQKLYGLTEGEIAVVEVSTNRRIKPIVRHQRRSSMMVCEMGSPTTCMGAGAWRVPK